MRLKFIFGLVLVLSGADSFSQYAPVGDKIRTEWSETINPDNVWDVYPRPLLKRSEWKNLNGIWQYAIVGINQQAPEKYDGNILVPFPVESSLSGVGKTVGNDNNLWYRRSFSVPSAWKNKNVMLNFGAVDWKCDVWVNGIKIGSHTGGYTPFSLDITNALNKNNDNELVVRVFDPTDRGYQPRGKQVNRPGGIWYTPVTGIWQTVWLEFLPKTHIVSYKVYPQPDNGSVSLQVSVKGCTEGCALKAAASFEGRPVGSARRNGTSELAFELPLSETHLWAPGEPNLYDLELAIEKDGAVIDRIDGYFGLRSIRWDDRVIRINGRPVFQRLILDQGFYPDGIYTAPSDEALKRDIELSMELGFNGARLHQKVFEERYLYWADRLGYIVWGEMASWGCDISTPAGLEYFLPEWIESVERDFNHPALVGWCPFNETWDHPYTGARQDDEVLRATYLATKALDPTRPVIDTSGNFHVITDIYDIHDYDQDPDSFMAEGGPAHETFPHRQKYGGQPYFVSEYGGTWWNPAPKDGNNWGYGNRPESEDEVLRRFAGLAGAMLENPAV